MAMSEFEKRLGVRNITVGALDQQLSRVREGLKENAEERKNRESEEVEKDFEKQIKMLEEEKANKEIITEVVADEEQEELEEEGEKIDQEKSLEKKDEPEEEAEEKKQKEKKPVVKETISVTEIKAPEAVGGLLPGDNASLRDSVKEEVTKSSSGIVKGSDKETFAEKTTTDAKKEVEEKPSTIFGKFTAMVLGGGSKEKGGSVRGG
jgi:hypothetical protein